MLWTFTAGGGGAGEVTGAAVAATVWPVLQHRASEVSVTPAVVLHASTRGLASRLSSVLSPWMRKTVELQGMPAGMTKSLNRLVLLRRWSMQLLTEACGAHAARAQQEEVCVNI